MGQAIVTELKKWRFKTAFNKDDNLVFPNGHGNFENHNNMRRRIFDPLVSKVVADAGQGGKNFKRFGWHALRHFAISTWIEAGLTPTTVQTFAGHSSLAVTMDRYGHLFPSEAHKAAMDGIASALFSTNGA
ncbi:tyrosine-type recombinase/integrase [Shinella sp. M31]|uniref:tyrosine-type recombinase/integrase n=1 Tax=Shinella sp. M31 TaxID=3368615 RepID=UPI003B9ED198